MPTFLKPFLFVIPLIFKMISFCLIKAINHFVIFFRLVCNTQYISQYLKHDLKHIDHVLYVLSCMLFTVSYIGGIFCPNTSLTFTKWQYFKDDYWFFLKIWTQWDFCSVIISNVDVLTRTRPTRTVWYSYTEACCLTDTQFSEPMPMSHQLRQCTESVNFSGSVIISDDLENLLPNPV